MAIEKFFIPGGSIYKYNCEWLNKFDTSSFVLKSNYISLISFHIFLEYSYGELQE